MVMHARVAEDSIFVHFVIMPGSKNLQPENFCDRNSAESTQAKPQADKVKI
jgi:hypothetical protein